MLTDQEMSNLADLLMRDFDLAYEIICNQEVPGEKIIELMRLKLGDIPALVPKLGVLMERESIEDVLDDIL